MPWSPKRSPKKPSGYQNLNNRPVEILHNHEKGRGRVVPIGYSEKAPEYHLFKCLAYSTPPRRQVVLKQFDRRYFSSESKAGLGGCSMRGCPGDAEEMNEDETQAYCRRCARRARGIIPCPSTTIQLCHRRLGLDLPPYGRPCPTCTVFEEVS